jgi:hypothetical protein
VADDSEYFKSYGEYTYVKISILRKRDEASSYFEKISSLKDDCAFNKMRKEHYIIKFKAAVRDLYIKIAPYLENIKKKDDFNKLEELDITQSKKKKEKLKKEKLKKKGEDLEDFKKYFMLLHKAIYALGISDLNINAGTDPRHVLS